MQNVEMANFEGIYFNDYSISSHDILHVDSFHIRLYNGILRFDDLLHMDEF